MNPANELAAIIETVVRSNGILDAAFPQIAGWLDIGIPPADGPYPCIRIDGIMQEVGKETGSYTANVKVWSNDMSVGFYDLVDTFAFAIQNTSSLLCENYIDRAETGLFCALFPVRFWG